MNFEDVFFHPYKVSKYINFELPVLLDLLTKHTTQYSELIANGQYKAEEFTQCRDTIMEIQKAIQIRIKLRRLGKNPAEDAE